MPTVHLLTPRGEVQCGAEGVEATAEITKVTCVDCINQHNAILERQRIADRIDGYDRDDLGESPDY